MAYSIYGGVAIIGNNNVCNNVISIICVFNDILCSGRRGDDVRAIVWYRWWWVVMVIVCDGKSNRNILFNVYVY